MINQPQPPILKNPAELLQVQVNRLSEIYQAQQEQLNLLRSQNEYLNQNIFFFCTASIVNWSEN